MNKNMHGMRMNNEKLNLYPLKLWHKFKPLLVEARVALDQVDWDWIKVIEFIDITYIWLVLRKNK